MQFEFKCGYHGCDLVCDDNAGYQPTFIRTDPGRWELDLSEMECPKFNEWVDDTPRGGYAQRMQQIDDMMELCKSSWSIRIYITTDEAQTTLSTYPNRRKSE